MIARLLSLALVLIICFGAVLAFLVTLKIIYPEPEPTAAAVADLSPVVEELAAEIAAREAELDELESALVGAVADRDEAVAMLRSAGLVIPVEMPDVQSLTQSHDATKEAE